MREAIRYILPFLVAIYILVKPDEMATYHQLTFIYEGHLPSLTWDFY